MRVSSQAMISTRSRVSSARTVMSPRLPIGVAVTIKPDGASGEPDGPCLGRLLADVRRVLLRPGEGTAEELSVAPTADVRAPVRPPDPCRDMGCCRPRDISVRGDETTRPARPVG